MSKGYNYNPIPTRVWSRVQNPCTFIVPGSDYSQSFIPLTGQTVSQDEADYETKQINKGNILQYKGNSARLSKSQKYSQLARCVGPNRTKVFATQSQTYTNPNTTGLLRVGSQTYPFPNEIVGAPNNISGPFEYNIPNPNDCSGNSVQDGGILVCGTYSNPCTGEIIKKGVYPATVCNPASASNVPGFSTLCWNNKLQSWFPRQRYFMNNSTDKWPINYKGLISSVYPESPVLTATTDCNSVTLSWTESLSCFIITSYEIYVDNSLYDTVLSSVNTYKLNLDNGIYDIYIIAKSNNFSSLPSNIIVLTILPSIVLLGFSNVKKTVYESSGYTTVVIENTIQPSFNVGGTGTASAYICGNIPNINCLIIGGGGGGASGYYSNNGGGGGGGGAINLITNLTLPSFTNINISVGSGGGGRTPGNQGGGSSTGNSGYSSSMSFGTTKFESTYGGGGLGVGTASGYGGGLGGNATNINGIGNYSGYGGSSGGGAWSSGGGTVTKAGSAGIGYTANGNKGNNGNTNYNCGSGGNGGNSVYPSITIPGLGTINISGAGGGGGKYGGNAGNGTGGNGGIGCTSTQYSPGGQNASTYGAGGGGGGSAITNQSRNNNTGGNGANGVIIIWYQ